MNKIHRIVCSAIRGAFIVAHEKAASHGKPSSTRKALATGLMASLLGVGGLAMAAPPVNQLPTGGQIVGGAAAGTISSSGAAMTINQNQQRMIANWDTYSIGQNASVHYQQPTGGVALNRVTGGQPSEIFGKLTATGAVYLLNSAGIIFGHSAQVDVGALLASTGKMSDSDFLAGRLRIAQEGATGKILNEGELKAAMDGYIALLAPEVRNQGVIFALKGTVALAAGEAYELQFDGTKLANVRVEPGAFGALVSNGNAVEAPGVSSSSGSSSGGDTSSSSGSSSGGDTSSSSGSSSGGSTSGSSSSGFSSGSGSSSGGDPSDPSSPDGTTGLPAQFALRSTGESEVVKGSGGSSSGDGDGGEGGAGGAGGSNGFISVKSFGNLEIPAGSIFTFTLPKDTFKHADPKASVAMEARSENGPLPDWLIFEPGTGKFTGRPPESLASFTVIVTARDNTGNEVSTKVVLNFDGKVKR